MGGMLTGKMLPGRYAVLGLLRDVRAAPVVGV